VTSTCACDAALTFSSRPHATAGQQFTSLLLALTSQSECFEKVGGGHLPISFFCCLGSSKTFHYNQKPRVRHTVFQK
jgi:hypothetical protein